MTLRGPVAFVLLGLLASGLLVAHAEELDSAIDKHASLKVEGDGELGAVEATLQAAEDGSDEIATLVKKAKKLGKCIYLKRLVDCPTVSYGSATKGGHHDSESDGKSYGSDLHEGAYGKHGHKKNKHQKHKLFKHKNAEQDAEQFIEELLEEDRRSQEAAEDWDGSGGAGSNSNSDSNSGSSNSGSQQEVVHRGKHSKAGTGKPRGSIDDADADDAGSGTGKPRGSLEDAEADGAEADGAGTGGDSASSRSPFSSKKNKLSGKKAQEEDCEEDTDSKAGKSSSTVGADADDADSSAGGSDDEDAAWDTGADDGDDDDGGSAGMDDGADKGGAYGKGLSKPTKKAPTTTPPPKPASKVLKKDLKDGKHSSGDKSSQPPEAHSDDEDDEGDEGDEMTKQDKAEKHGKHGKGEKHGKAHKHSKADKLGKWDKHWKGHMQGKPGNADAGPYSNALHQHLSRSGPAGERLWDYTWGSYMKTTSVDGQQQADAALLPTAAMAEAGVGVGEHQEPAADAPKMV